MKDLKYLQLWDCYGGLLTDNQREICELYYMCDLSLSEIAEQKGCSKQSVSDTLSKSRALLDGFEERLHHHAQNRESALEVSFMTANVCRAVEAFSAAHPEYAKEMEKIKELIAVGEHTGTEGGEE